MRSATIPIGIAVVVVVVVAALIRWRATRRKRLRPLPPLVCPLGKANTAYGARPNWQEMSAAAAADATPRPVAIDRSFARPNASQASSANGVTPITSGGLANDSTNAQPNARPTIAATGATTNVVTNVASNVNNGASISAIGSANNGVNVAANSNGASAHVVNGRGPGASHVAPPGGARGNPPPPLITPTHLKVVRDVPDLADEHEPAPTETVRFRRPVDEAVQLLPGRLEVLSGDPRHQEIRFVRIPGRPAELILGREPGDTAQHVALRSSTVSRQHARFVYVDGHWHVANLSSTNPVVVNGEELSSNDAPRGLNDGDRVELGEVVMRFRTH